MQYSIRNVPRKIDAALRKRARQQKKSLNQVTIEALAQATGQLGQPVRFSDLDSLAGTWQEDPKFDEAIADQDQIDADLWK